MIKGFRDFLLRGNVIDLAVAVVIGTAFGAVINAIVAGFITPLIGAIIGKPDYNFTVGWLQLGLIITALINFLAVAAVVYFVVVVPVNAATARFKREEAPAPPEVSKQEALLMEIRDLLARRQAP